MGAAPPWTLQTPSENHPEAWRWSFYTQFGDFADKLVAHAGVGGSWLVG